MSRPCTGRPSCSRLRSTERKGATFHWDGETPTTEEARALLDQARTPTDGRIVTVQQALRGGLSVEEVHDATGIDPWFLDQMALVNELAEHIASAPQLTPELLRLAKRHGDTRLSSLRARGVRPEMLLGLLAWSCGWIERVQPVTARELIPLFRMEAIPPSPLVLTPQLLELVQ